MLLFFFQTFIIVNLAYAFDYVSRNAKHLIYTLILIIYKSNLMK